MDARRKNRLRRITRRSLIFRPHCVVEGGCDGIDNWPVFLSEEQGRRAHTAYLEASWALDAPALQAGQTCGEPPPLKAKMRVQNGLLNEREEESRSGGNHEGTQCI